MTEKEKNNDIEEPDDKKESRENSGDSEKKSNLSLITTALSGTTGGAILGAAICGGPVGAILGSVFATSITGLAAYYGSTYKHKKNKKSINPKKKGK